jgi:hydrocephalus-inducing protein
MQAPDPMNKIDLTSMVRDSINKLITIENPLNNPVEIKKEMLTVDNDNIFFNPNQFTIPPKSEFGLEILFRPLLVAE